MSPDIILHHYGLSPYSEKVRRALAYKRMPWVSVEIPPIMPKPDLMPLTGGYRKTPVLQIGRDVYCDTKLICRLLDHLQPERPLVPAGLEATAQMVDRWVERFLFFPAVALFFQPEGLSAFAKAAPPGLLDLFLKDRAAMFAKGGNLTQPDLAAARAELPGMLASIESQLTGRAFLHGEQPTLIDFSVYHPLWFLASNPGVAGELEPYPAVRAWIARIVALGDGDPRSLPGAEAVAICRSTAQSQSPLPGGPIALAEAKLGQVVRIAATDYGVDAVQGELVIANRYELAIQRQDERAGTVVVHFPPEGFSVTAA